MCSFFSSLLLRAPWHYVKELEFIILRPKEQIGKQLRTYAGSLYSFISFFILSYIWQMSYITHPQRALSVSAPSCVADHDFCDEHAPDNLLPRCCRTHHVQRQRSVHALDGQQMSRGMISCEARRWECMLMRSKKFLVPRQRL